MNTTDMEKFKVKKVAGPIEGGAAVFLGNKNRAFVVFVGLYEATAIIKELQNQPAVRPLTHDLMHNIMVGFDIDIKNIFISKIIDNTFCATLVLEQKVLDEEGNWHGRRNEVHIDARASDSIIMALKTGKDIWVTREVYEKVEDVSDQLDLGSEPEEQEEDSSWKDSGIDDMQFDMPDSDGEE